jgi:hypothetical protein
LESTTKLSFHFFSAVSDNLAKQQAEASGSGRSPANPRRVSGGDFNLRASIEARKAEAAAKKAAEEQAIREAREAKKRAEDEAGNNLAR